MTTADLGALGLNLAATLVVALVCALIAFAVGVSTGLHRHVDVAWGLLFVAIAGTGLVLSAGHGSTGNRWLVTVLTTVWGVRLAAHIGWRGRGTGEDRRYERLLSRATGSRDLYALRYVYLLQGVIAWFVSLPVQAAQYNPAPLSPWVAVGVAVWAVGLAFEAAGDAQLIRFQADPANRGKVLDTGLWRYTRHPNYFGEALLWWGFGLIGVATGGVPGLIGPAILTFLLIYVSGVALLESTLIEKAGYIQYVGRTPAFLPLPPHVRMQLMAKLRAFQSKPPVPTRPDRRY